MYAALSIARIAADRVRNCSRWSTMRRVALYPYCPYDWMDSTCLSKREGT